MGACSTIQQAAEQETTNNKRHCTRRQSARFKSEECEPTEKLIQIEDTKLPASKSLERKILLELVREGMENEHIYLGSQGWATTLGKMLGGFMIWPMYLLEKIQD